jgi:hypothetical protein
LGSFEKKQEKTPDLLPFFGSLKHGACFVHRLRRPKAEALAEAGLSAVAFFVLRNKMKEEAEAEGGG